MIGFKLKGKTYPYHYVKDALGNVIAISDEDEEVARYEYDVWGNCTIKYSKDGIAGINPFRWKSQYYDQESELYYIGGRYYSPLMKQYISAASPETAWANAATLYGLNLYLLSLTNPVSLMYNEYTIETNVELSYDPPEPTGWEQFVRNWNKFWKSWWGKGLAIGLFVAATVLAIVCPAFLPIYASAVIGVAISLTVGVVISGFRSITQGGSFFEAYVGYINDNWSQTLAISMAVAMISFGISQATQAMRNAGAAGKEPANSCTGGNSNCFIAGTLVLCRDADGNECHKLIEDIAVGDYVWAYDEETDRSDWKPVVRLFRNETKNFALLPPQPNILHFVHG